MRFYVYLTERIAKPSAWMGLCLLAFACEPELNELDRRIDGISVDQFFEEIPSLPEPARQLSESEPRLSDERTEDGKLFSCNLTTVERVDLLDTLTVPAFNNPKATQDQALYPGALLFVRDLHDAYRLKSLDSVPRSPLSITSTTEATTVVSNPLFRENVEEAIQALSANTALGTIDYQVAEIHSLEQALLDMHISRNSLSSQNVELLRMKPGVDEKAVLIKFVQTYHTIRVAEQLRPSGYFAGDVTVEDLKAHVTKDDPIGLIEEVSYGRIILGKLTYEGLLFKEKDSLSASVIRAFTAALRGDNSPETEELADARFEVVILGGDARDATSLSDEGGIRSVLNAYRYLEQGKNNAHLGVPIQFKVRYLSTAEPFRIGNAASYQTFDCRAVPKGVRVRRVILTSFPGLDQDEQAWDAGMPAPDTSPDIFLAVNQNGRYQGFYQDVPFVNMTEAELPRTFTDQDDTPLRFDVSGLSKNFQLEFWDRDESEDTDQFMGKIRIDWDEYNVRSDHPTPRTLDVSKDGFHVTMNLIWLY